MIALAASRIRVLTAAIADSSTIELGHGVSGGWFPGSAYSRGLAGSPWAFELGPRTRCSLAITASAPAASASTAIRTSARRSRGGVSVQFSLRTRTSFGGSGTCWRMYTPPPAIG